MTGSKVWDRTCYDYDRVANFKNQLRRRGAAAGLDPPANRRPGSFPFIAHFDREHDAVND
jgi:hypothetical protein